MRLASRLAKISTSPTIAVMQEAQRLRGQGIDVIDFGPGQPDFPTPDFVKEAGRQAIEKDFTRYTANAGIDELRQALAEHLNRAYGSSFGPENLIVTNGAKSAVFCACMALFQEGDEVLIPAPYWVTFPEAVKLSDASPTAFPTQADNGFELTVSDLEPAISADSRGIIVNSPNNPTGAVIPADSMSDLVELCKQRGVAFISDETYDRFTYEGRPHASLASYVDPEDEHYALIGSFSKTYAMTGWRVGFLAGCSAMVKKVNSFVSHQAGNPCSISQKAAVAALLGPQQAVDEMLAEYAKRRRYVVDELNRIEGISCPEPYGAFYAFPNIEGCLERVGLSNSVEFAKYLINEAQVAAVPGSAFGMEGHIRISYATSMSNLEEGLRRIAESVRKQPVG